MKVYVVRDTVGEVSSSLFEAVNDGVALRHFSQLVKNSDWASEFELYQLGSHDPNKLGLCALSSPRRVIATVSTELPEEAEVVVNE